MGVLWVALRRRSRHVVISKRENFKKKKIECVPLPHKHPLLLKCVCPSCVLLCPGGFYFLNPTLVFMIVDLLWIFFSLVFFLQYNCDLKTWSNAANAYYCFRVCSSHLQFFFLCTNKQILLNVVVWHRVPFVVFGMASFFCLLPSPDDASGLT